MDPKDQQTLLIAVYKENADQARHHEQQREKITSIIAQTTGVVLGLLSISKAGQLQSHPLYAFIALFLVALALVGFMVCWKHNERAELHRERIGQTRKRLSGLSGLDLEKINADANAEHKKHYPVPERIHSDWGWKLFHILVALLGAALLIVWGASRCR